MTPTDILCIVLSVGLVWLALEARQLMRRTSELAVRVGFLSGALSDEELAALELKVEEYMRKQYGRGRAMSDRGSRV